VIEGHSYGSTVVAEAALRGDGLDADDILTAGSPGMHTDRAADLQIDPRHVRAGQADGDHVAGVGGSIWGAHGNEPSDKDFGANRYVVDTEGHSAYWTPGTESLRNQALVVVGQYDAALFISKRTYYGRVQRVVADGSRYPGIASRGLHPLHQLGPAHRELRPPQAHFVTVTAWAAATADLGGR
jgi:hypothetical protein